MKPSAPSKPVWVIGMIAGILGVIGHFVKIDVVTPNSFWLLLVGFFLLALGTAFKGV